MKQLYLLISTIILTSCVTMYNRTSNKKYIVEVDTYGSDSYLNSKKYFLAAEDSTIIENNLQYIEFSDYIRKILSSKGYAETQNLDDADLTVFFRYGISAPETFYLTYTAPTLGQKNDVSSITTRGHALVNPYTNHVEYNQTIASTPKYGRNTKNVTTAHSQYLRYVTLTAYDLNSYRSENKEKIAWNTILTSRGSSDDLRKVIPYMIAVGSEYIGKSSGEKKLCEIYENDKRVNQLKVSSNAR